MAERAHVTSVDAIEAFRSALIVYLSKARPTLDDASGEVLRTREWLRTDRRIYWENQMRRRARELDQAEQALFSVELSKLREPTTAELKAVQKARRAFNEAEEKLILIKRWSRELETTSEPMLKQLEQLRTILTNDMPKSVAYLAQAIKSLDAYANVTAVAAPSPGGEGRGEGDPQSIIP